MAPRICSMSTHSGDVHTETTTPEAHQRSSHQGETTGADFEPPRSPLTRSERRWGADQSLIFSFPNNRLGLPVQLSHSKLCAAQANHR